MDNTRRASRCSNSSPVGLHPTCVPPKDNLEGECAKCALVSTVRTGKKVVC